MNLNTGFGKLVEDPALQMFERSDKLARSSKTTDITYHKHYSRLCQMQAEAFARYGVYVPSKESLDFIASVDRPIVEIGSGNGYLANKLSQRGLDVVAVEPYPTAQSKEWLSNWNKLSSASNDISFELYYPTVRMSAEEYFAKQDWCRGKALLLMNHNLNNWVETFDWDLLKSDAIIVSFSSESYHEKFRALVSKSHTWTLKSSIEIPKYYAFTPNRFQKLEIWTKRQDIQNEL